METFKGLPVYDMTINYLDAESGVEFISLVESPAIEINWVKFSEQKAKQKSAFSENKDKRMLYGPFMVPGMLIYRVNEELGEYYVRFSAEQIELISKKFFKEGKTLNLNVNHADDSQIDAIVSESWLTGKSDKSKDFGYDLPEKTWFGGVFIESEEFWNQEVLTENVKGFSIEGWLNLELNKIEKDLIKQNKIFVTNMIKKTKIKMKSEVKTKDGVAISSPDDAIVVGSLVFGYDETGAEIALADGEYILEEGSTLIVSGGKVDEIKAFVEEAKEELETEEVFALTPEDVQTIIAGIQPTLDEMNARIIALEEANTAMSAENTALKTQLSAIPGIIIPKTAKTDETVEQKKTYSKMNVEERIAYLSNYGKK